MNEKILTEIQADAFRGLVDHLRKRSDAQNIDIMNLAGFCRNCLSKWLVAGAEKRGTQLSLEDAREMVYGMPYDDWKREYQLEATEYQKQKYQETMPLHAKISAKTK